MIRSDRSYTSWMSWLIRKIPRPSSRSCLIRSPTCLVSAGPSAAVGSSMIRIRALKCTARAIATDWRCPPESEATGTTKFWNFGFSRPISFRVASSIALSSRLPNRVVSSRPRNTLPGASMLSASARF